MKKLAIGCAVVIVLCMIGFGAVAFYTYYKFQQYAGQFKSFAEVAEMDKRISNTTSFPPPANGELTDDQVRRFVAVQQSMQTQLGSRLKELDAKYDQLNKMRQNEHRDANFSEAMGALGDLLSIIKEAKTAQVKALNDAHFSLSEYNWVREQFYTAAGIAAANINFSDMQDAIKKAGGQADPDLEKLAHGAPEHNRALIKPYLDKTKDWTPFAFFGL
jgi:hypothetical protein